VDQAVDRRLRRRVARCDRHQPLRRVAGAPHERATLGSGYDLVDLAIDAHARIAIDLDLVIALADAHAKSLDRRHAGDATP